MNMSNKTRKNRGLAAQYYRAYHIEIPTYVDFPTKREAKEFIKERPSFKIRRMLEW